MRGELERVGIMPPRRYWRFYEGMWSNVMLAAFSLMIALGVMAYLLDGRWRNKTDHSEMEEVAQEYPLKRPGCPGWQRG